MRCDACKFWIGGEEWREEEGVHANDRIGTCHRYAPRATVGQFESELLRHLSIVSWAYADNANKETDFKDWEDAPLKVSVWPSTNGDDWCGEWRKK